MKTLIEFAKLSGSGNDFICIDSRDGRYEELLAEHFKDKENNQRYYNALVEQLTKDKPKPCLN